MHSRRPSSNHRLRAGVHRSAVMGLALACGLTTASALAADSHPKTQPSRSAAQDKSANKSNADGGFTYDKLTERAKSLAKKDYTAPKKVPGALGHLSANQLSKITYNPDKALWADSHDGYQVMFYPAGSFYDHAIKVHVVDGGKTSTYGFDKNNFNYASDDVKNKMPDDVGYAGLKILHALANPKKQDETMSFLGASYFRALSAGQHYGLSSRGLAIDTGNTEKGEEFPNFTDFWLVKPSAHADHMTIYALLDSPSVTGAYKFVVTPGKTTHTQVESTLFTRRSITKLGVAPLTSMFTWGENSLSRLDDYRPEAHDSDGMLISAANGEWLWRPLVNPQKLSMNQFSADNVRGFGLMQRDRDFDDYQDLDYQYENRPNAWITPKGDWGKGHLELVEIPSDSEVNDNIDLYWVPAEPVKAGQRLHFAYDIAWSSKPAVPDSLGHAQASRIGMAAVTPGQQKNQVKIVIDFVGGELAKRKDANTVQPRVNAGRDVTINNIQATRNPHTGGWRLSFLVPTSALGSPLNLRAYLADPNGGGLTETWNYQLATP